MQSHRESPMLGADNPLFARPPLRAPRPKRSDER